MAFRQRIPQYFKIKSLEGAFFLILLAVGVDLASAVYCRAGHYYKRRTQDCHPCQRGTFMPYDSHQHPECLHCAQPESHMHEYTATNCTATTDTVIRCTEGYYWHSTGDPLMHRGSCTRCTSCQAERKYVVKECDALSDTFCCPEPNMVIAEKRSDVGALVCKKLADVANDNDEAPDVSDRPAKVACIPRVAGCARNERMVSYNAGNEAVCCEPCPEDTFVNEALHTRSTCLSRWNDNENVRPESGGEEISPKNNSGDSQSPRDKDSDDSKYERSTIVYIGVGVGCFVIICIVIMLLVLGRLWFKRLRHRENRIMFNSRPESSPSDEHKEDNANTC